MVAEPVSVKVPGYGPVAAPDTVKVTVEVPSGWQLVVTSGTPAKCSPDRVGGGTWACAAGAKSVAIAMTSARTETDLLRLIGAPPRWPEYGPQPPCAFGERALNRT